MTRIFDGFIALEMVVLGILELALCFLVFYILLLPGDVVVAGLPAGQLTFGLHTITASHAVVLALTIGVISMSIGMYRPEICLQTRRLLVNSVVGFIGPEYLFDGRQIIRAGLEDHFCAKLLGLPMGVDICYTNHAEADQNDMDVLLTLLASAGCNFVMGVPGSDDIMLNYQTTSFHDALYVRRLLGLRPAPEFEAWLQQMQIVTGTGSDFTLGAKVPGAFQSALRSLA